MRQKKNGTQGIQSQQNEKEKKEKCCCDDLGQDECPIHSDDEPKNQPKGEHNESIRESEGKEKTGKKKCPPMSHIKKMCQDGKSVAEICKMHPDCDHSKLKKMIADCKKQTVKETDDKMVAAAIWRNMKETTAYMAEKKAVEKLKGNENFEPNPGKSDKGFFDRVKEMFS